MIFFQTETPLHNNKPTYKTYKTLRNLPKILCKFKFIPSNWLLKSDDQDDKLEKFLLPKIC